jgi:uncharacterized membrane protein
MPFVFGIILSAFIGYILGPLVFLLAPLIIGLIFLYLLLKSYLPGRIERWRERRKVKRLLKERLKYLP